MLEDEVVSLRAISKPTLSHKNGMAVAIIDTDVIGIDKGISALMIENYMSEMIWNIFMDIDYIQDGLTELGFTSRV